MEIVLATIDLSASTISYLKTLPVPSWDMLTFGVFTSSQNFYFMNTDSILNTDPVTATSYQLSSPIFKQGIISSNKVSDNCQTLHEISPVPGTLTFLTLNSLALTIVPGTITLTNAKSTVTFSDLD